MEEKDKYVNNSFNKFSIFEILIIFLRNKKPILIFTSTVCIISIILYFFVFDLIYLSQSSIKSSSKVSGVLGMLDGSLPDVELLDEVSGTVSKSTRELASYEEILNSRTCLEPFIKKFNIMEDESISYTEDALKFVREEKLKIEIQKKPGVMYLGVYDPSPVRAKEMVEYLLEHLDKINIQLNITNARNNKEFIEKRYFQSKEDLLKAEDSLEAFQMIYGVAPDLQVKASTQIVFTMEGELQSEEVKLEILRNLLSSDQPEVKLQEAKVNKIKDKVSEIRNSTDISDILKLGNSPQIIMHYLRMQREVEIQNKILAFLLPLYEQAKIEEKRDTPTILILDYPNIPDKKVKPKRLTMVIIFTFCGFLFALFLSGLKEYYVNYKERNPEILKSIKIKFNR